MRCRLIFPVGSGLLPSPSWFPPLPCLFPACTASTFVLYFPKGKQYPRASAQGGHYMTYLQRDTVIPPVGGEVALWAARGFRDLLEEGGAPPGSYTTAQIGEHQTVKASWGYQDYFFVYAYISSVTEFAQPGELEERPLLQAWIFRYRSANRSWEEVANLQRDGWKPFWNSHQTIKQITGP